MCGGFAVASADSPIAYHLGRLTTYLVLGAIAGSVGSIIPGPPWVSAAISIAILGWFCLRLADIVPAPRLGKNWVVDAGARLANRPGIGPRYTLGMVTALLPCGLVWATLGIAVASDHLVSGLVVMAAFWLGTVPLLSAASLGLLALAKKRRRIRVGLAAVVFLAGLWSISHRVPVTEDAAPQCHVQD